MLNARAVQGSWRRLRWAADGVLIAILMVIPWIRIGDEPLVLLDIPARKFHIFGLVIFPEELFFLWLILAGLALSLFFFTALVGRVWCGWACPQTVFTDVFAGVARRVQGWKGSRPPRRVAAWRIAATHAVWLLLCAVIGFHLVAYFRTPRALLSEIASGTLSRTSAGFLVVATALAYADFVWIKQTFCKFLCPYARFQGVLFDRDTLVVGYDAARGEPRGKAGRAAGDCVDCRLCVQVCPTGIDIREGLQLECITCTQCIDACNGVMAKLGRAPNLIGYGSLVAFERVRKARLLRPRVVVYAALLAVVTFTVMVARRLPMDLQVAHNTASLYTKTADGRVGNAYTLHIQNRERGPHLYRIRLEESDRFDLVTGVNPVAVPPISTAESRVFVLAKQDDDERGSSEIRFVLEQIDDAKHRVVRRARFIEPGG
jgi:cytochrome c oxidase accessory protein FixG